MTYQTITCIQFIHCDRILRTDMSVVFGGVRRSLPSSDIFQPSQSFSSNSLKSFRTQSASLNRGQSLTPITNYSTQPRRMTNTVRASNISAILAVGEELRQLLHAEDPPIIKDRRYHLKVYESCFVGHEMVDWLLRKGEVESRAEAVAMMQKLLENEVIHHGKLRTVNIHSVYIR